MRDHIVQYAVIGVVGAWGITGFITWANNPELTYMQVWLKMVGL